MMKGYSEVYSPKFGLDDLEPWMEPSVEDNHESLDLERFFFQLPREETEVMVSMFLGLTPKEIVAVHSFKNIGRFYSMSARLRESYRAKKAQYLGYD